MAVAGIDAGQVGDLEKDLNAVRDGSAIGLECDLRSLRQTDAAFAACERDLGPLDIVVAIAGGSGRPFGDGPIDKMTAEAWDETFGLNATPVMTTARAAIRAMAHRGGSLVVVSSVLAVAPAPPRFETHAYAAAKGAALALVKALAASYASQKIRVNAVMPAVTDTPMAARAAGDADIRAYLRAKQPLTDGIIATADVAALIAFLASDGARAITGQLIAVDGGWSVTQAL